MIFADVEPGRGHILVGTLMGLTILLLALVANTTFTEAQQRTAAQWYNHTLDVLLVTGRMRSGLHASAEDHYGFVITGDPRFEAKLRQVRTEAHLLSTRFATLTADNPQQTTNVARYTPELRRFNDALDAPVQLVRDDDMERAVALVQEGSLQVRLDRLLSSLDRMEREEQRLLTLRRNLLKETAQENRTNKRLLLVTTAGFIALAAFAALALVRSRRRLVEVSDQLHHFATTDPLTGLSNRRQFEERFDREIARATRTGDPLCLAFVDIDHFKTINDRHGHDAGDIVLQEVAAITRGEMRAYEEVGRLGGEEFGILMIGTDETDAVKMCERMRVAIAARTIAIGAEQTVAITVSMGLARLRADEDRRTMTRRADEALYAAKNGGRNQICQA